MLEQRREINRRRIHDDVANYLLADIREGVYTVGQELPSERDMMEEFAVGRPAVREALSKLHRMGLVDIRAGVRAKVCKPSVSPLLGEMGGVVQLLLDTPAGRQDFQWLRGLFESALARYAARSASAVQIDELRRSVERQHAVVDNTAAFAELDMEFHRLIAQVADKELIMALHQTLARWLLDQRMVTLGTAGQSAVALAAHECILQGIANHDPDEAEAAMSNHLQQVQNIYQASTGEQV